MAEGFQPGDFILMYHGTVRRDAARLAGQLRILTWFFEIVPLAALAQPRRGRRRAALTFDDGLRSNVTVAYPVLRALRLTATFFVCPGLIEQQRWLWNHEARERLRSLPRAAIAHLAAAVAAPAAFDEPQPFVMWMKKLDLARRRSVEAEIRDATPAFAPSAAQREQFDVASWQELRRLDARVVSIGSHSATHPILTSLGADDIESEVALSRAWLEAELGRPVADFCYPNGDFDARALEAARRHYQRAVGVGGGALCADIDPHRLPRLAADPAYSLRLARALASA
jgi:peptidoglycan/xylan/chitin deacetylase (PgdA/CDA1 family)